MTLEAAAVLLKNSPQCAVYDKQGEYVLWSGKGGSNSRPCAWQAHALPAELFPHNIGTR